MSVALVSAIALGFNPAPHPQHIGWQDTLTDSNSHPEVTQPELTLLGGHGKVADTASLTPTGDHDTALYY